MSKKEEFTNSEEIRILPYPDCYRDKIGMYLGGNQDFSQSFLEILSNSFDQAYANSNCKSIIIDQNWGGSGLNLISDSGSGLPIAMSKDIPDKTQAYVSLTQFHSGTKFYSTGNIKTGSHGIGSKAVCATSQNYIVLSRITEDNYDKSIPEVYSAYMNAGPKQKNQLYYCLIFEKGHLQYEGADTLKNLEKLIFEKYPSDKPLPTGMSTIVLFNADLDVYEKATSKLPIKNIEYFCLILEKIYGRKINIQVNGENFRDNFKPYEYEFVKTIVPANTSKNSQVTIYVNFEIDEDLEVRESTGSVNGLETSGINVSWVEAAYEMALKSEYKVNHKYKFNGLRTSCILLADSCNYDSQTKVRCKSVDGVKASDVVEPLAKEFIKIFRKNSEKFEAHIERLDKLAESMKSFSARDRSMKMVSSGRGVGFYKSRAEVPRGFADATNPDRLQTELYLCFPAEQEILLIDTNGETYNLAIGDLAEQFKAGNTDGWVTFATTATGRSRRTRIIACQEIKKAWEIVKVTLSDGETSFRCTPDHKIRLEGGEYKEASKLEATDRIMFCENSGKSGITPALIQYENLTEPVPVYCLEVQDREHNFPLNNQVVVKNCEGVSSASGLVNGRHDTKTAAIMPLRGKVLNVSDKDEAQALDNKEINAIFKLIGLGTSAGNVFESCTTLEEIQATLQKYANYGKIIIATDAKLSELASLNCVNARKSGVSKDANGERD